MRIIFTAMSLPRHILLLEADPIARSVLADVLTDAGHRVTACAEQPAALQEFDVVLGQPVAGNLPYLPLHKPVRIGPLLARIAALSPAPPRMMRLGPWSFNPSLRTLDDAQGNVVRLTDKETGILLCLLNHPAPVSREQLLAEVWGYSSQISTHTLETHIYRLRQKIEPDPAQAQLLLTEAGGYSLSSALSSPPAGEQSDT